MNHKYLGQTLVIAVAWAAVFLLAPKAAAMTVGVPNTWPNANGDATIPVSLSLGGGDVPAAIAFDLHFGGAPILVTAVEIGSATSAAGKILHVEPHATGIRVLIGAVTEGSLGDGVLAEVHVSRLSGSDTTQQYSMTIADVSAATLEADWVGLSPGNATLTLPPQEVVWVDFAWNGQKNGHHDTPYSDLALAMQSIASGGTVKIKGPAEKSGPMYLSSPARLEAHGGKVSLGKGFGAKSFDSLHTSADLPAQLMALVGVTGGISGANSAASDGEDDANAAHGIYAPVMPFSSTSDGVHAAQPNSVLAIRLRADAALDVDSLLATFPESLTEGISVEWQSAADGAKNDLWVLFRPMDLWRSGDAIDLEASALSARDGTVVNGAYTFAVDGTEQEAVAIPQPLPGLDYEQADLGSDVEASDTVIVTETAGGYHVGPEQVFPTPQRVWLPLPQGGDPQGIQLHYYQDGAWYPAAEVAGWIVPESEVFLQLGDASYYGFAVRHGGIVRVELN